MRFWMLSLLSLLLTTTPMLAQDTPDWLSKLDSYPCPDSDFTCVTLSVPLDHFNPDSTPTMDVTFAVLPATGERKGIFVTATGGPGYAGLAAADYYTAAFDPAIPEMFDIVFFDQRGIGSSGGLDCPEASAVYYQTDQRADTPEREAALIDAARTFSLDCVIEMQAADWLTHLGTAQAVEDLELFRQAVGDEQIWLYGESYGTQFVQTYAAAHPDHVAGLILDGVVDLTLDGITYYEQQVKAFDDALTATLTACNTDQVCAAAMGGDAIAAYDDLEAELNTTPVIVDFPLPSGGTAERQFTGSDLAFIAASAMYENTDRMIFLRALAAAVSGDLVPLLRLAYFDYGLDPQTLEVIVDPTYSNGMFYGVECNDYSYFEGTPAERAESFLRAGDSIDTNFPRMSSLFYGDIPCLFWPTEGEIERPNPFTGEGIPTFILNSTLDPATPVSNGYRVFSRLDDAYMITLIGGPHVIYGRGNACPDITITAFLTEDALPAERQYICDGDPIEPYIPLISRDDMNDPITALQAIDNTLYYLPEYYYWDTVTPTDVGCTYGGTLSFTPTDDGDEWSLSDCELIDGIALSGTATNIYGESLTLDLTISGTVTGDLVYTRDDFAGMFSLSGVYRGEDIVLTP